MDLSPAAKTNSSYGISYYTTDGKQWSLSDFKPPPQASAGQTDVWMVRLYDRPRWSGIKGSV